MQKPYKQQIGRVVELKSPIAHTMAIALDPKTNFREGVVRCVVEREGEVDIKGYIDRSQLYKVKGKSLQKFKIGNKLEIKNEKEIIDCLKEKDMEFIGLEDPDIWRDEKDNLHLYFTIPFINRKNVDESKIHLGHAVGKDLDSLTMTMPVLMADGYECVKEVSIAPISKKGIRYNLVESNQKEKDFLYPVVRVAEAEDMGEPWRLGGIVFHPKLGNIPWIGGHASPGPLLPKSFINLGEGKLLGLINGREKNKLIDGVTKYGMFSVGLFIYNFEEGKIEWVSEKPLIRDTAAKTITFSSQFVETSKNEGILYTHVDDSFIRAYYLKADWIKDLLPKC